MPKIRKDFITAALSDLKDIFKITENIKSWLQNDNLDQTLSYADSIKIFQEKETAGEQYITLLEILHDKIYYFLDLILSYIETLPVRTDSDVRPSNVYYLTSMTLGTIANAIWNKLQELRRGITKMTITAIKITGNIRYTDNGTQTDVCTLQQCASCITAQTIVKKFINIVNELFKYVQTICKTNVCLTQQNKLTPEELLETTDLFIMQTYTKNIELDLKSYLRTIKQYRDKSEAIKTSYEEKIHDLESEISSLKTESQKLTAKLDNITKSKSELELELYKCKAKLEFNAREYQKLEIENESMQKYCTENTKLMKTICSLEAELQSNIKKCNIAYERFQETEMHTETLISNNKKVEEMLNSHIDELKDRHAESIEMISKLEQYTDEKEKVIDGLKVDLDILQKRFKISEEENMEKDSCIQEMELKLKEYEKKFLILLYNPDFFSDVSTKKVECEPIRDMENQIEANETRMQLLSKHNEHLRNILQKLKSKTIQ